MRVVDDGRIHRVQVRWRLALWPTVLALALLVLLATSSAVYADDAAPPAGAPAAPRLPMLSTQGPMTKVEGKISRSSRGRKGPVRILVERQGGPPVTVLVAPDEYCDSAGLSLKPGETISAEGTMVKGDRPILLAVSITADGKTTKLRDASGKLIDADGKPVPPAKGATLGGGTSPPVDAKPVREAETPAASPQP